MSYTRFFNPPEQPVVNNSEESRNIKPIQRTDCEMENSTDPMQDPSKARVSDKFALTFVHILIDQK